MCLCGGERPTLSAAPPFLPCLRQALFIAAQASLDAHEVLDSPLSASHFQQKREWLIPVLPYMVFFLGSGDQNSDQSGLCSKYFQLPNHLCRPQAHIILMQP